MNTGENNRQIYGMNIDDVDRFALSLGEQITRDQFTKNWFCWRVAGKWFMLTDMAIPEQQVSVKLPLDLAIELQEQYDSITPAVHMNKPGWYELYLDYLEDDLVRQLITTSYNLVASA